MSRFRSAAMMVAGLSLLAGCSSGEPAGSSASSELSKTAARTLVHRALRSTPTDDLLLDPFITSDESWGHFLLVRPATATMATSSRCPLPAREILSASPAEWPAARSS